MNKCIKCSIEFEPNEELWLFCELCQSERMLNAANELYHALQRLRRVPELKSMAPQIIETQCRLLERIYAL